MRNTRVLTGPLTGAAILALAAGLAGDARAAGFSIYEQGAKASGQAGAFTARADDPSALFYNPAGITQLDGWSVYGNINAIALSTTFHSFQKVKAKSFAMDDDILAPGSLFVVWSPEGDDRFSFGLGITTPFGLTTRWGEEFEGRYLARESTLKTAFITPTVAVALDDKGMWSLAGQVHYAWADVTLSRNLDFSALGAPDGFNRLDGSGDGWGGSLSLHFANPNGWRLGMMWRSQTVVHFDDADAEFRNTPALADALFCAGAPCFPDTKATGTVTLPESYNFGFGKVGEKFDWEFDIVHTMWEAFDELRFDFEDNTTLLADSVTPENWENVDSFRLGFGWHLNPRYELRFGVYHDEAPTPTKTLRPTIPDADRDSAQIGLGWKNPADTFSFDAYYQALMFDEAKTTNSVDGFNGRYTTFAHIVGIAGFWRF